MKKEVRRTSDTVRGYLIGLSRPAKSAIAIAVDLVGFSLCTIASFWLLSLQAYATSHFLMVGFIALLSVALGWMQGMYRSVVRYMGIDLLLAGVRTAAVTALAGALILQVFIFGVTPKRWAIAYALFAFLYVCGSRYLARSFLIDRRAKKHRDRVLIYGAGSAGDRLATSLKGSDQFLPVAMLDDDPTLHGKKVQGLEVYPTSRIELLCDEFDVTRVLLAMPRVKGRARRHVLESLSEYPVHVQTIPDFADIVSGKSRVDDVTDVDVKDLLGRDPVPAKPQLLQACITGKSVMVTGAGGSIGSELSRQILALEPKNLILFEISEAALYNIHAKLERKAKKTGNPCNIVALLGSVHHRNRVVEVMQSFAVQTVYHAAAYKHVPIVEQNIFEGIHNNVLGTNEMVLAAIDASVETFVLISTDKAVSPTNIMGATKRFAELILQAHNNTDAKTRFCMVRFGNVLESSGSVVPLFREQIRHGGPVTVTHRDIIRYFMTIPEAAELVIQAGSMAKGGDVFVLDMGEPVRIQDLAYRMVKLMGLTVRDDDNPEGDIDINYIGLRPAEKLYEELLIGSNVTGTQHPRIMRADEEFLPLSQLNMHIIELEEAALASDYSRARKLLGETVNEYRPSNGIDDLVWKIKTRGKDDSAKVADTVVDFPSKKA